MILFLLSIEIIITGEIKMNKQNGAFLSIASNSILVIFKISAGISMNSISVISEGIHSSIDLIASLIAFFSIKKASKSEDKDHPFGHGKYENVSGFVEALLILFAGIIIVYESLNKLFSGSSIENIHSGLLIMFISTVINLIISLNILRISKKEKSIALEADALHLLTDVFTSFGVFAGLIVLKITGLRIFDSISAIIVASLIIKTSISLVKKSMKDLVDSRLSSEDIGKILDIIKKYPEVKSYHKLRTRKSGYTREIDLHLLVDSDYSLIEAHNLCNFIEKDIKTIFPDSNTLIHVEPYHQ